MPGLDDGPQIGSAASGLAIENNAKQCAQAATASGNLRLARAGRPGGPHC